MSGLCNCVWVNLFMYVMCACRIVRFADSFIGYMFVGLLLLLLAHIEDHRMNFITCLSLQLLAYFYDCSLLDSDASIRD